MGEKNDLLSAVASDNVVDCVEHLVEYLSCRVFGQAMYRHVTHLYTAELFFGQLETALAKLVIFGPPNMKLSTSVIIIT